MRTRVGAQLLSVVMFAAAAYSGYLVVTEIVRVPAGTYDASQRISEKAVAWATTLAVFYGVFLEERQSLSRIWNVAEADAKVAKAVHEVDARQGASLLCVGLLGEAVIGFVDLGRASNVPPTLDSHAWLSFFFLLALLWISSRHVRLHDWPWRSAPSHSAPGGDDIQNPATPSSENQDVQLNAGHPDP